jgi:hypothetical protein
MGVNGVAGGMKMPTNMNAGGKGKSKNSGKSSKSEKGKSDGDSKNTEKGKNDEKGQKGFPPGLARQMAEGRYPPGLTGRHGKDNDGQNEGGGRADSFRNQATLPPLQGGTTVELPPPPQQVGIIPEPAPRPAPTVPQGGTQFTPAPGGFSLPSLGAFPTSDLLGSPSAGNSIGSQLLNARVQPARPGSQIIDANVLGAARGGDTVGFINALAGNVNSNLNGSVQQFLALTG